MFPQANAERGGNRRYCGSQRDKDSRSHETPGARGHRLRRAREARMGGARTRQRKELASPAVETAAVERRHVLILWSILD